MNLHFWVIIACIVLMLFVVGKVALSTPEKPDQGGWDPREQSYRDMLGRIEKAQK